jgi:hypothetical protein
MGQNNTLPPELPMSFPSVDECLKAQEEIKRKKAEEVAESQHQTRLYELQQCALVKRTVAEYMKRPEGVSFCCLVESNGPCLKEMTKTLTSLGYNVLVNTTAGQINHVKCSGKKVYFTTHRLIRMS